VLEREKEVVVCGQLVIFKVSVATHAPGLGSGQLPPLSHRETCPEGTARRTAVQARGGFSMKIWIQPRARSIRNGRVRASVMIIISVAPSIPWLMPTNGEK
jgi:hypothetical protein